MYNDHSRVMQWSTTTSAVTNKDKVGFTCGAFDLLHAGHILMLEEAANNCDYLIVGLHSNPVIDRPNKNKPIQSLYERWVQLFALDFIDKIIPYETEDELYQILLSQDIDVRFIGEEYKDSDFTGKDIVGIEIFYNKRKHKFSSTELRNRVYNELVPEMEPWKPVADLETGKLKDEDPPLKSRSDYEQYLEFLRTRGPSIPKI